MNRRLTVGLLIATMLTTQMPVLAFNNAENSDIESETTNSKEVNSETPIEEIVEQALNNENNETTELKDTSDSNENVEQDSTDENIDMNLTRTRDTTSGECGENLTWTLNGNTLTISGTGDMYDYNKSPWCFKRVNHIIIEDGITSIGDNAFDWCTSLANIELPDTLQSIGNGAFGECISLTNIELPDTLQSIGERAFFDCISLTNIELPDTLQSIGEGTFSHCYGLANIELPDTLQSIGEYAFSRCSSLTNIELPDTLQSIGNSAFLRCSNLTNIELPDTLQSIGEYAFWDCTSLANIELPDTLQSIGKETFRQCTSLVNIELPDTLQSIGEYAFWDCTSLTNIELPDTLQSIGEYAFWRCTSLVNIELPDTLQSISEGTFTGCTSLTNIELPDTLQSIGNGVFWHCTSLTNIELPDTLQSIGNSAFEDCTSLANIELPDTLQSISESTFSGCTSLTNIELPDTLQSIGNGVFKDCTSLTSMELPDTLQSIGKETFRQCTSLANIELPDTLQSIGEYAFWNCTSLANIELPDTLQSIGNCAFEKCTSLTNIELPDTLKRIEDYAFSLCKSLKTIIISKNTTRIGLSVFSDCELNDIYYSGSEEEWKANDMASKFGDAITSHTIIHYNYEYSNTPTNPENPDKEDINGKVQFITKSEGNLKEGKIYCNDVEYAITNETKITGIENLTDIVNDYVLVETDKDTNQVISIQKVESAFGTYKTAGALPMSPQSKITIDDNSYLMSDLMRLKIEGLIANSKPILKEGTKVFYHIVNNTIVGFDIPTEQTNVLYTWNPKTYQVEIYNNYPSTDYTTYDVYKGIANKDEISKFYEHNIIFYTVDNLIVAIEDNGSTPAYLGKCGENVYWRIEGGNTLIISGTGEMYNYNKFDENGNRINAPWMEKGDLINSIIIENGVKSIGDYAFIGLTPKTINVGLDVNNIGKSSIAVLGPDITIMFNGKAPKIDLLAFSEDEGDNGYPINIYYDKTQSTWNDVVYRNYSNKNLAWIYTDIELRNRLAVDERWHFRNDFPYFTSDESNNYVITYEDEHYLLSNVADNLKSRIIENKNQTWGGSCRGMSVVMALLKNDNLGLSHFSLSGENLADIEISTPLSEQIQSVINFYHLQQNLPTYEETRTNFLSLSQNKQLEKLETKIKECETNGKVAVIGIAYINEKTKEIALHAIIGYAIEKGHFRMNINGKDYLFDRRILTYDPAYAGNNQQYYNNAIYYKSDYSWLHSVWAIPGYNAVSKNNNIDEKSNDNTGALLSVNNESKYLNIIDYKKAIAVELPSSSYTDRIDTGNSNYTVKSSNKTFDIQQGLFNGNTIIDEENKGFILYSSDSNGANNIHHTLILPETNDNYIITTNEPIEFKLLNVDHYLQAESNQAGTVNFKADGKVEVSTPESGNTRIAITSNDSPLLWSTIEVENDGVKELSAEWTEEGVVISGDELKDVKVTGRNVGENEEKALDFTFDVTDEKNSVLIKANDTDTELVVMVDTNNDGTYDTPIDEVKDTPEKPDDKPNNPDDKPTNPDDKPDDKPNNPDDKPNTPTKPETPTTNKGRTTLSSSYPRHDVTVSASRGGTVKVNTTRATKGTPVQLTVEPETGYILDELIVRDKDDHTIDVTKKTANLYTFVMPEGQVDIDATFKEKEATKQTPNTVDLPFTDIPADARYMDAVKYVYDNKMMKGDGNETTFNPNGTLTRAMLVTILHRLEGTPQAQPATFNDVAPDAWYHDAIAWASANDVVAGHSPEHFAPSDAITYEQLNTILVRYAKMKGKTPRSYTDGYDNPKDSATRADVAVILKDFMKK